MFAPAGPRSCAGGVFPVSYTHLVDIVCPAAAAVLADGIADEGADGAGDERAADADEPGALEGLSLIHISFVRLWGA